MEIIGQIIGIIAMAIIVLSFQEKSNKKLFFIQTIGAFLFAVSYLLIKEYTGAILNAITILRGLLFFFFVKKKNLIVLLILEIAYVVAGVLTYSSWTSILPLVACVVETFFMWLNSGKIIRLARAYFVSPCWLVYNAISLAIGGIICEVFNIASVIVSFFRHKKDGFTD